MRAYFLPEVFVVLLVLLLAGLLFMFTADYVVGPAWVWIFGQLPADQPWLKAIPLLASALLVWVELRGVRWLAELLMLSPEERQAEARRRRGRRLP